MSLPSSVGLPNECMLGSLDFSMPQDSKSMSVKIQPSNLSSIVTSFSTGSANANTPLDIPFPSQNIIFDLPCGQSPSTFLDTRFTTLNFRMNISVVGAAGAACNIASGYLRSHANSFFDRMYVTSQSGTILEDIQEYSVVNDTLIALQMNNSVRDGIATQYGFSASTAIESQGHPIAIFAGRALTTGDNETHSYSVPLVSSVIGVTNSRFLNIGRTSKLQCILQTSNILPLSILTGGTMTNASTIQVTLSDFSIQCEYLDIGLSALSMLDATLVDKKCYLPGVTYRTSTTSIPSGTGSGSLSLLAGIRASSVKSLFTRFTENGLANSPNGKFDSKNPVLSQIAYNIGGTSYPQVSTPLLLNPSQAMRETQLAIGSWNSSLFQSCLTPTQYCKLSTGGTAQGVGTGASQEYSWNTGGDPAKQSQFIYGVNLENCMKRGLLSGLNCTSAPIFINANVASTITNAHTMYVIAMMDSIIIHDIASGDISVRI